MSVGHTPRLGEPGDRKLPAGALAYMNMRSAAEATTFAASAVPIVILFVHGPRKPLVLGAVIGFSVAWLLLDLLVINRMVVRWTSYRITDELVYITRGAILRRSAVVPIGQILNVETVEGPLLRRSGFANVKLRCITTEERIGPVSPTAVLEIRRIAHLVPRGQHESGG